jgi:AcrR family transcriptional regulator
MVGAVHGQQRSRRERLRREREARILESAAAVFARKGFYQATIREIAELADVADGTIYNYYANKRDLLVAMLQHLIADSVSDALAQSEAEDERRFLTVILSERFDFLERNLEFVRALMTEVWADTAFREQYLSQVIWPLLTLMEGYLQGRIDAGTVRPVNARITVRAMAGSFLIFLLLAHTGQKDLGFGASKEELVGELVDFFLLGIKGKPDESGGDPT